MTTSRARSQERNYDFFRLLNAEKEPIYTVDLATDGEPDRYYGERYPQVLENFPAPGRRSAKDPVPAALRLRDVYEKAHQPPLRANDDDSKMTAFIWLYDCVTSEPDHAGMQHQVLSELAYVQVNRFEPLAFGELCDHVKTLGHQRIVDDLLIGYLGVLSQAPHISPRSTPPSLRR